MKVVKPRTLKPGATLGIVSPAGYIKPERLEVGLGRLHASGYKTKPGAHVLTKGPLYYAGTVAERVADLHAAFADPAIDAVLCSRGGWGCAELLPHLDAHLIRESRKPFIGFSDPTSVLVWMWEKCRMVAFHGPMAAADWAKSSPGEGVERLSWTSALGGAPRWELCGEQGLRMLKPGTAEGVLRGGCLSIVAAGLGTPYGMREQGGILFLEDVGVDPYQWDRMLCQLRQAGVLDGLDGIVLGDMRLSCPAEQQELLVQSILHALEDFDGPVAIGLRSGHIEGSNVTLPFGVRVRLECQENPTLHFLESATEA